jgi:hypothetical protein
MRRCDWCEGPFGLICHRHIGKRFCRKTCKAAHVRSRRRARSARLLHWLQVLHPANSFSLGSAAATDPRASGLVLIPIAADSRRLRRPVRSLAKIHTH